MKIWVKIILTFAIIIAIILTILGLVIIFSANVIDNNIEQTERRLTVEAESLEPVDIKIEGDKLTGVIENSLGHDINYLEINFKFYDKENIIIDESVDITNNLKQNEKWKFEIYLINEVQFETYDYTVKIY